MLRLVGAHLGRSRRRTSRPAARDGLEHSAERWAARKRELTAGRRRGGPGRSPRPPTTSGHWPAAASRAHPASRGRGRDDHAPPVAARSARKVPSAPRAATAPRRSGSTRRAACMCSKTGSTQGGPTARPDACTWYGAASAARTPGTTWTPPSSPSRVAADGGRQSAGSCRQTASPASGTGTRRSASPPTARSHQAARAAGAPGQRQARPVRPRRARCRSRTGAPSGPTASKRTGPSPTASTYDVGGGAGT